jgi:putative oxidoreductase
MGGTALLGVRLVVGGYFVAHGAQKLFGKFGGYGIQGTGGLFDSVGLTPGPEMARLAGITELTGGVLTATGALHPLGPVAVAGVMTVAVPFQRAGGPFAPNGFELPLTNLAIATALAASGPGKLRLGPRLPKKLAAASILGAAVIGGYLANKLIRFQPASEVDLTQSETADQTEAAELGTA